MQKEKRLDEKSRIMMFACMAAFVLIVVGAFVFSVPLWQLGYQTVAKEAFDAENLFRVELNTADKEALCSLPGIGEKKAEAILNYRAENGPFDSLDTLAEIKGISNKNIEAWKEYLYIE